jgi:hypothetical protein
MGRYHLSERAHAELQRRFDHVEYLALIGEAEREIEGDLDPAARFLEALFRHLEARESAKGDRA